MARGGVKEQRYGKVKLNKKEYASFHQYCQPLEQCQILKTIYKKFIG